MVSEATDRVLAPNMIAEIYEKLERDKNITLARCFDYIKMIKKNKTKVGSSFAPVDVDGPVARRLDYKVLYPFPSSPLSLLPLSSHLSFKFILYSATPN